jgi:hypothetical protein
MMVLSGAYAPDKPQKRKETSCRADVKCLYTRRIQTSFFLGGFVMDRFNYYSHLL